MLTPAAHPRMRTSPWSRVLALALTVVVGWSSVEVLWSGDEPAPAGTAATEVADVPPAEDDCPCLCACACQAVHVVLPAPEVPTPDRVTPTIFATSPATPPQGRSVDPPYRPPRRLA